MRVSSKWLAEALSSELDYFTDYRDEVESAYRTLANTFVCAVDEVELSTIDKGGYYFYKPAYNEATIVEYHEWDDDLDYVELRKAVTTWQTYREWRADIEDMVTDLLWIENSVRGFAPSRWEVKEQ